jgi:hypothetical protein
MSEPEVSLATISRVLSRLGWNRVGGFRQSLEFWEPDPSSQEREFVLERIVLPRNADAADAADLLEEATAKLSARHREDFARVSELVEVMLARHLDEIDVRRATDNEAGLIRWALGNQMVDSTRAMLAAAAKAANRPRKRFLNAESTIAEEFLQQCYMGQTRIGSYVVTALTPSEELFSTSRAEKETNPRVAGRAITATLAQSLAAVHDAIEQSRDQDAPEAFEEVIPAGVSFELLQALEPLTENTESEITVTYFRPSSIDDPDNGNNEHRQFAFTPRDGEVIARARAHFEKAPEPRRSNLVGEVTLLKNSSAVSQHQIKLDTKVNGRPRVVTVNLSAEQYDEAVSAHGQRRLFTVVGDLELRTKASVMESPELVRIEPTPISAGLPPVGDGDAPLFELQ